MKDAFGVERVSKADDGLPAPKGYTRGGTFNESKAKEWAAQGYKVRTHNTMKGSQYSLEGRVSYKPTGPRKHLIGPRRMQPDFANPVFTRGNGTIDPAKYGSRKYMIEQRKAARLKETK